MDSFRRLADFAGARGMRILIENMPGFFENSSMLLELVHQINHQAIGVNFDTAHANICNLNLAEEIRNYGKNLLGTHISDSHEASNPHTVPGWGNVNWIDVVKALNDINYQGLFNLEIPGARDAIPELTDLKIHLALESCKWLLSHYARSVRC